ncbi:MAG: DMT family transporter [Pseudomonadota bacterium]
MLDNLSPLTRGTLLFVLAIFLFSLMDALANHLTKSFHPFQVVWARYTFHVVVLALFLNRAMPSLLKTKYFKQQMVRSFFVFGATATFFYALFFLTLPQTTAIFEIAPILITFGAFLFLGEKIGPWRWAGVFAGFVGAMIIIRPGFDAFSWATLLPVLTATFFAGYALSTRAIGQDESPWTNLVYTALVGMVIITFVVPFYWSAPTSWHWVQLVTIGTIGAVGHFFLIRAFRETEASALAPWSYSGLMFSILWGVLFFAEIPDLATFVGAFIIVAAGMIIWWRESRRAKPEPISVTGEL